MSYKSKWIELPELKYLAQETDMSILDLADRNGEGYCLDGAYASNVESKLRSWGFSTPAIMNALADALGYDAQERQDYPNI